MTNEERKNNEINEKDAILEQRAEDAHFRKREQDRKRLNHALFGLGSFMVKAHRRRIVNG